MEYLPDYLADRQARAAFGADRVFDLIRLLELTTATAYYLAVANNPTLAEWMATVNTGDLVAELTTLRNDAYTGQRVGVIDHLHRDPDGRPSALLLRTPDGQQRVWDRGTFVRIINRLEIVNNV